MLEGEGAEGNGADQYKEEQLKDEVTETKEEWKVMRWISLILYHLKLSSNLSNAIFFPCCWILFISFLGYYVIPYICFSPRQLVTLKQYLLLVAPTPSTLVSTR